MLTNHAIGARAPARPTGLARVLRAIGGVVASGSRALARLGRRLERAPACGRSASEGCAGRPSGLRDRVDFLAEAAEAAVRAGRDRTPLVLAMLDLERFRAVNEVLGRAAGDRVLAEVGRRLRAAAPADAVLAHVGGDGFLVLAPCPGGRDAAEPALAALRARICGPLGADTGSVEISARIAAVIIEPLEADMQKAAALAAEALEAAPTRCVVAERAVERALGLVDLAMARTKAARGRGVVFYDGALDEPARERRALAFALPRALADESFSIHYQPQVTIGLGAGEGLVGYEALLRCNLPDRGWVSPAELIPIAEETQAILPIGEWVLRNACLDAARWDADVRVAVNLSPVQMRHDGLVEAVRDALWRSGLPAERLELEVTETAMIDDMDRAVAVLTALRRIGVQLAIDDFGVGYSSLRNLKAFRFDKIKLDRELVTDILTNAPTAAIARSVVALGRELATPVLAEGVETRGTLDALAAIGCSEAQGYLIGRPAPLAPAAAPVTPATPRAEPALRLVTGGGAHRR